MSTPTTGRELTRFEELAGAGLYRRNVFAVTGLPPNAQGRTVRQHRKRLETRLAVEETWPGDPDSPLAGGHRRDEVRAAFETFQDPRQRLVDELLWLWGDADFGCGCPRSVHEAHDKAVRSHAEALEAEGGRVAIPADRRNALWSDAATGWGRLLQRPEFRRHLAHRIRALEDPRLGEHSEDDFLARIPRLLLSPFPELAVDPDFGPRLAGASEAWTVHTPFSGLLAELLEGTVEETVRRIRDGLTAAKHRHDADRHEDAATILREQVLPAFEGREALWAFASRWQYEETARMVAVALNNVALGLWEEKGFVPRSPEQEATAVEFLEKACKIGPESASGAIRRNLDAVRHESHVSGPGDKVYTPSWSATPARDTLTCLLVLVGLVGLIVEAVFLGVGVALTTGFLWLVVLGAISEGWDWIVRHARRPR